MAKKQYKNLTLSARMELFIVAEMGWKPIESKNKYKMFERLITRIEKGVTTEVMQYLFLGKNGAVRSLIGSKNAAKSHSMSATYFNCLEDYEKLSGEEYLQNMLDGRK
jgi:Ni,Fe-hydrogenase III component G